MIYPRGVSLKKHKRNWDRMGEMDPLWAALTDPQRRFGKWNVDEFFATGEDQVTEVLATAKKLGYPTEHDRALDFGCGVGRLSRALAHHFQHVCGVDISDSMIAKARELNASIPQCEFFMNATDHLQLFPDQHFDMVFTTLVLQHLPERSMIYSYVAEFLRTLKKGGLLVFQLPNYIPLRNRVQPRRRLYSFLRPLGVSDRFLYEKLGL